WEKLRYGMFIHYGLSTYIGDQFGRIPTPSTTYAPTDLDVEQWIRVAKDAGMRYVVLTVKHHYGHCLWPSEVTDYDVETASDKTDVVRALVTACRRHGILPGFYYSLGWDRYHMSKRTHAEYERFVLDQMGELLTDYGPIAVLWFDIPWDMGADMAGALARLYAHCKRLQPDCLVLYNQGFVDGSFIEKRRPSYIGKDLSDVPIPIWPKDLNNGERVFPPESGHEPRIAVGGATYYIPDEVCDTILQERWFWGKNDDLRPARTVFELYRRSIDRGANLLLNVPPDRTGRIPEAYIARLMEVRRLIDHPEEARDSLCWGRPVTASNIYGNDPRWKPEHATDLDVGAEGGTRWATDDPLTEAWLEVDLGGPRTFDSASISEFLDQIRRFAIEIPDGRGGWSAVHEGTTIGGLGIRAAFEPATADRVRLHITKSTGGPTIWDFQVHPSRRP
ncbi:MAG: alpha-L-fucosidase, partial [Planctomycetes bacterium]|nr:alpha-L-fucosidase [Planctomycetota bacterium]